MFKTVLRFSIAFIFTLACSQANAQTIRYVKPVAGGSGDGSSWANASNDLQAVINAIPVDGQIWVASGTYKPNRTLQDPNTISMNNPQNVFTLKAGVSLYGGFSGSETQIGQRNWQVNPTILSGDLDNSGTITSGDAMLIVMISGNGNARRLDGFTITGGNTNSAIVTGGGIEVRATTSPVVFENLVIAKNTGYYGGGMYVYNSSVVINNVTFDGNEAYNGGGIFSLYSQVKITSSSFIGNKAGNLGGGLYASGASSVIDAVNVIFKKNSAQLRAGAAGGALATLKFTNTLMSGNSAPEGGGIFTYGNAVLDIKNSTIVSNSAQGIKNTDGSPTVTLKNSIVYGNDTQVEGINVTYNKCFVQGMITQGNLNGTLNPNFVSPLSAGLSDGGDYRLQSNSYLLNAGDNSYIPDIATDLAGNDRIYRIVDVGAYEYFRNYQPDANGRLYVKLGNNGNGSSWTDGLNEVADALAFARLNPAITEIWVSRGTYRPLFGASDGSRYTDKGTENAFVLPNNVKIYGGFAGNESALSQRNVQLHESILSGNLFFGNYSKHVVIAAGNVAANLSETVFDGFIIDGGQANGSSSITVNGRSIQERNGGGLYSLYASPKYANLKIRNSQASNYGGGLYAEGAPFDCNSIRLTSNTATTGGAIGTFNSNVSLKNAWINGNSATYGGGLGLVNGILNITGGLISGNTANYGGGIYNSDITANLTNVTITGNTHSAVYNTSNASQLNAKNSIIYRNTDGILNGTNTIHYSLVQGMSEGNDGNLDGATDPLFVTSITPGLRIDGNFNLQTCSPAINAGNNGFLTSEFTTDLSGLQRRFGSNVDLGGFENTSAANNNSIIYVRQNGTGNGSSWNCAAGNLQMVLMKVQSGQQVWVASGTYQPFSGQSFSMKDNVKIYGGFPSAGNPTMTDRNYKTNPTILQGNGNSVVRNDNNGVTRTAWLDGFILQGATGSNMGGGMFNNSVEPTVKNCVFRNNNITGWGGGVYNSGIGTSVFTNCLFYKNTAAAGGAVMSYNMNTSTFVNCTITQNHATGNAGGVHTYVTSGARLFNCIVWNNTDAGGLGAQLFSDPDCFLKAFNTIVSDDSGQLYGTVSQYTTFHESPLFTDADNDDYTIKENSPAIDMGVTSDYVTFMGGSFSDFDLKNELRIFDGASGTIDIGCYEYQGAAFCSKSTIWNGTVWSNGLPTADKRIVFDGNYSSTDDLFGCTLQVNSGNVVINTDHTVTIDGAVIVNGGSLTFENDAALVQLQDNAINSGHIVYKRNATPMRAYDFTYWSSPVASQNIKQFSPNTLQDKYFYWNTQIYNWSVVASPQTTAMEKGIGYIIRAPQGFSTATYSTFEGIFEGVANNGILPIDLRVNGSNNLNLVGNPYPSAIDADVFMSDPANTATLGTGTTLYFWTHNTPVTNLQYTAADYATYNYTGGTGTAPADGANNSIPDGKIAAGQGFFLKAKFSGTAQFNNKMRTGAYNGQFFRSASVEKHRFWLELSGGNNGFKQTLIGYVSGATDGFDDGFDGEMNNGQTNVVFYSMLDDAKLTIQGRALPFDDQDVIPMGYAVSTAGTFEIRLSRKDGLFENTTVYLLDKLTGISHDITQSVYVFTTAAGTFEDRFEIRYTNGTLGVDQVKKDKQHAVVYAKGKTLSVESPSLIESVEIIDMAGRRVGFAEEVNATVFHWNSTAATQAFIIRITFTNQKQQIEKAAF